MITGADGALGSVFVKYFQSTGYEIWAITRSSRGSNGQPEKTHVYACDLTDQGAVENLFSEHIPDDLDGLINLVGAFSMGAPVADTSVELVEKMFRVNFLTCFLCSRHAYRSMAKRGSGRIINIGALGGLDGMADASAYAASKAAVVNLTKSLALEGKRNGVCSYTIVPGIIDTAANRTAMPDADFSRWTLPGNLAETAAFLLSEPAKDLSGSVIRATGRF